MNASGDARLLEIWDRGQAQSPQLRASTLLVGAGPREKEPEVMGLPVGPRDSRLLALRRELFGNGAAALADCPHCYATVEFAFDVSDLDVQAENTSSGAVCFRCGEWDVMYRLPNTRDLASVPRGFDLAQTRADLLNRCVLEVHRNGRLSSAGQLPDEVITRLSEQMSEADPQGSITLRLTCPSCGESWDAPFDIASFLWTEFSAYARGVLEDVHELASAYGWAESEILSMAGSRRKLYLEMVGG